MSTEVLTQTLSAGVTAVFGAGSSFVIVTAVGPVSIVARTIGSSNKNRTFSNVPAGFKFTADDESDGFSTLEVTSPIAQSITLAVGDDDVAFSNAVTVNGAVTTQETPAAALTDRAQVVTAAGQNSLVAANGARRRITVSADPVNTLTMYLRSSGGANNLTFLQPGTTLEFAGTYAIDYTGGAGQTLYLLEES